MRLTAATGLLLLSIYPACPFAQSVITISPGANVFIHAGQLLSLDSLVLTPSSSYNLTGPNSITRNNTILDGASLLPLHILRSYDFSNGLSNYNGSIGIYYKSTELNSLLFSLLQVDAYGAAWSQYGSSAGASSSTAAGLTNFSAQEITLGVLVPLSMTWLSVTAERQHNLTTIGWTTADETNCRDYYVQRSVNAATWSDISTPIAALNLPGPNQYSWTDANAPTGQAWYRIIQTDQDNKTIYSLIMSVRNDTAPGQTLSVYPNPAHNTLYLKISREATAINVFDALGKRVLHFSPGPDPPNPIPISNLPTGIYTLSATLPDGSIISTRFEKK